MILHLLVTTYLFHHHRASVGICAVEIPDVTLLLVPNETVTIVSNRGILWFTF